jgi:hypothetical protein
LGARRAIGDDIGHRKRRSSHPQGETKEQGPHFPSPYVSFYEMAVACLQLRTPQTALSSPPYCVLRESSRGVVNEVEI